MEVDLDKKFKRLDPHKTEWLLHSWDNHGADFGFTLRLKGKIWSLLTYENSGYSKPALVIQQLSDAQLWYFAELFEPNNPTYKTD